MASNLYSAAGDLGLGEGDMLRQKLDDTKEERKKKLLRGLQPDNLMNTTAASMLLGPSSYNRA